MNRALPLLSILLITACTLITPTPPTPTLTSRPFDPVLRIDGPEQVIFDWTTNRCNNEHIPDLAARAMRNADGSVQLITSHYVNYRMTGPDLDHLTADCDPIMRSDRDADPSMYNDREWIAAPYLAADGRTIYALVHDEYQGQTHADLYPERCPSRDYFSCWYNTITLAKSDDGGATYRDALPFPLHLVASLPYQYTADTGPYGLRSPSNIILGPDDYYYAFLNAVTPVTRDQWTCLMRTRSLADPDSWRFWDGNGFDGQFADPYRDPLLNPYLHLCSPVDQANIGNMNESITYNLYLDRYVLLGLSADSLAGREVWGVYYSFSEDLLHWTRRKLLVELPLPWTVDDSGTDLSYLYPTLIASNSTTNNFETTYETAYLYYTRHNHGQASLDRDLIRVPVKFYQTP